MHNLYDGGSRGREQHGCRVLGGARARDHRL